MQHKTAYTFPTACFCTHRVAKTHTHAHNMHTLACPQYRKRHTFTQIQIKYTHIKLHSLVLHIPHHSISIQRRQMRHLFLHWSPKTTPILPPQVSTHFQPRPEVTSFLCFPSLHPSCSNKGLRSNTNHPALSLMTG